MPAAPAPAIALSRTAARLVVLVGDKTGSAPTSANEVEWLKVLQIQRSSGSSRLDTATFSYDLSVTGEKIVDTLAPKGVNRQVEVRELDEHDDVVRVLFWGKLAEQPISIANTLTVQWVASLDEHHFGRPLTRVPFWNPVANDKIDLDRPLIFNPEIDAQIQPNCSDKKDASRNNCYILFDVGGPNTAAARTTHGLTFTAWRLYQAAHFLCWVLNSSETYVLNPTLAEIDYQIGSVDIAHAKLKNVAIKHGTKLPEALDQLLAPFGIGWCVDVGYDADTDRSYSVIRFFVRNEGTQRELFLQRPNDSLDPAKSTVPNLSLNYNISALANRITGITSIKQREGTFELYKGWPESEDSLLRSDLQNDSQTRKDHPHAGRRWVLNESGAHTGLRPEITTYYSLVSLFGEGCPPIARKFEHCLSRVTGDSGATLESRQFVVEYWDPEVAGWRPAKWSFGVLEHEGGLSFYDVPPQLWTILQSDPADCRIRITATLTGDRRDTVTVERQNTSPNADNVELVLDLSDKFHDRAVHTSSIYYADRATADTADDHAAMTTYLERIRDREDAADLACSATLEGLDHPEYEIGNIITQVTTRNLQLNRNNVAAGVTPKYLQIMGISYDVQRQRMELLLESYDQERL